MTTTDWFSANSLLLNQEKTQTIIYELRSLTEIDRLNLASAKRLSSLEFGLTKVFVGQNKWIIYVLD